MSLEVAPFCWHIIALVVTGRRPCAVLAVIFRPFIRLCGDFLPKSPAVRAAELRCWSKRRGVQAIIIRVMSESGDPFLKMDQKYSLSPAIHTAQRRASPRYTGSRYSARSSSKTLEAAMRSTVLVPLQHLIDDAKHAFSRCAARSDAPDCA